MKIKRVLWSLVLLLTALVLATPIAADVPVMPWEWVDLPSPEATPIPVPQSLVVPFGQQFQKGVWQWQLVEVKRRKALYCYFDPTVAEGTYLLVFMQLTNIGSSPVSCGGCDGVMPFIYGANSVHKGWLAEPWSIEKAHASFAAARQFTCQTFMCHPQPGETLVAVKAWDLPAGIGDVYMQIGDDSVYLGNFAGMAVEDQL